MWYTLAILHSGEMVMRFIKKHKEWLVAVAVALLIVCLFTERPGNYSFGITYIANERMAEADFNKLTGAMRDALSGISGYENADIDVEEISIMPDEGTGRQNALSRLLYGSGVIYIADYDVVRSIVDDDGLFAPLPDSVGGDIESGGKVLAKSLKSFGDLGLSYDYDNLCIFIRSDDTEDKDLSSYMRENYDAACLVLEKIEKN